MRIAILCRGHRTTGGVSGHNVGLADGLARLGHEVHVFTGTRVAKRDRSRSGEIVHWIPGGDLRGIANPHLAKPIEVVLFLLISQPILVFTRGRYDAIINNGVYSSLIQDVVFVHSCIRHHLKRKATRGDFRWRFNPHNWLFSLLERRNLGSGRRYGRALFVSRRVMDQCRRFYDVPEGKWAVVHNGIDETRFPEPEDARAIRESWRSRLGVGPDSFLALFAGYNYEQKGLFRIMRALTRGVPPNVVVVVAGRDPARERAAERLAAELGVRERLIFLGNVEDMAACYAGCDALVFPAEGEAFSMVVLEAMVAGLPVVLSGDNGATEFLEPGKDAVVLDDRPSPEEIAEAVRGLVEDPTRRRALSEAGRARARSRGWALVAREVADEIGRMREERGESGEAARP